MVRPATDATAVAFGALLASALFFWAQIEPPASAPPPRASAAPARVVSDVPRIGLERVDAPRAPSRAGERDVFDFGAPPRTAGGTPAVEAPPLPPASVVPLPPSAPATPMEPPLQVKFIGAVQRHGTKVAVLMTEQKEILTAQAGDVVANRLRVVRIGFESVDVQDVGGGATRRLPLRAN
jgi:hypothetical protein